MQSAKELSLYVLDQLSPLPGVRCMPMMGGSIFYYRERVFGGIYPGGFYVKDTKAARAAMPDAVPEPPLEGARPMLPVTILEDREALQSMVRAMYDELPERKTKKKGNSHGL